MFHHWTAWLARCKEREQGQGLVEYALILSFVVFAVVGTMTVLGTTIRDGLNAAAGLIP